MGLTLITAPTEEPVSIDEAKTWAKISGTADNSTVKSLVKAARILAEKVSGRAICTQTWDYFLDKFPEWEIRIPKPPLVSVTYVKYYDTSGTLTTISSANYRVITSREPGIVEPVYGESWPLTREMADAVVVRFVAGYGTADDVPEDLKTAIKKASFREEIERAGITDPGTLFMDFWHGCYDLEG